MALVISMIGAPGAGKSTLAFDLAARFKREGKHKVELVTEYAKDAVYSQNKGALGDQFYLTAKHNHRLMRLQDKVDLIITDSCLLNACIYANLYIDDKEKRNAEIASLAAKDLYLNYDNFLIYISPQKKYAKYGRTQTESESKLIDEKILKFLNKESSLTKLMIDHVCVDNTFDLISNKLQKDFKNE